MTIPGNNDYFLIDNALWQRSIASLSHEDQQLLERVRAALSLAADISRSDVVLLLPRKTLEVCVVAHARPHSMASLYSESIVGDCYPSSERRWLWRTVSQGKPNQRVIPEIYMQRPEVSQQFLPIMGAKNQPLAAVGILTNAIERERHRRRDVAFQRALTRFMQMLVTGQVIGSEDVPPFREHDGIIFVDHIGRYRYLSGQASNVYRRLGYLDDLRGRALTEVGAGDWNIVQRAWTERRCVFLEDIVHERILLRSAIPLFGKPERRLRERVFSHALTHDRYGALILIKDVTEPRQKARELKVKAMMLKEVHHRVKNNLQMLISIMRMQARRAQSEEARQLLLESINRMMSMTVIHESLSLGEDLILDLRSVVERIVTQVQAGVLEPRGGIQIVLEHADPIQLPTSKTTACALVLNELLLNSLKHGFGEQSPGHIAVRLLDGGDIIELDVIDNGRGLPDQFSLEQESSLGLDIIRTLVQDDLKGTFELLPQAEAGTRAVVKFPKVLTGGKPS